MSNATTGQSTALYEETIMRLFRVLIRHYFIAGVFIGSMLTLGACAQKAKVIKAGATQFEAESLAAIEKIDELRRKEIEATPLQKEKASELFVEGVKKSTGPITLEQLRILINPLIVVVPQSEVQWQAFLQKMRLQYNTFADTFASLDKGSLLAASDVKETVPILDKLIAQMVAFAKLIQKNPAEFIRERAAIAAEMEQVRDAKPHTEVTDLTLLELERRLREIAATEERITRNTIEQALKAATLGSELRGLLVNFDKLSVDDIAEGLTYAFKLAGSIPGLNLSGLEARTNTLIAEINKNEGLKGFFDAALNEINEARESSG